MLRSKRDRPYCCMYSRAGAVFPVRPAMYVFVCCYDCPDDVTVTFVFLSRKSTLLRPGVSAFSLSESGGLSAAAIDGKPFPDIPRQSKKLKNHPTSSLHEEVPIFATQNVRFMRYRLQTCLCRESSKRFIHCPVLYYEASTSMQLPRTSIPLTNTPS